MATVSANNVQVTGVGLPVVKHVPVYDYLVSGSQVIFCEMSFQLEYMLPWKLLSGATVDIHCIFYLFQINCVHDTIL